MDKSLMYVLAIARSGSIHSAADELYISQPSLSRYLSKLEKKLGITLFTRTPLGMELTEAGRIYVAYGEKIMNLYKKRDEELALLNRSKEKQIRIGMSLNGSVLIIDQIQKLFLNKYPDCKLDLFINQSGLLEEAVQEGVYDIAIGDCPEDSNLYYYQEFRQDSMVLLVPASCKKRLETSDRGDFPFLWVDLQELKDVDFIFQDMNTHVRSEIDHVLKRLDIQITPKLTVNNSILAIQSAERQQGCCIISSLFLPYIVSNDRVRCYSIGEKGDFTSLGYIARKGKVFTETEKYSMQIIKKAIHQQQTETIRALR